MDIERVMTVQQAARALSISRGRAYQLVEAGKLASVRVGERIFVVKGEDGKPLRQQRPRRERRDE